MKTLILLLSMMIADTILSDINGLSAQGKPINYLAMSKEFLTAVRNKEKIDLYLQSWASCDLIQLSKQVETDQQKLAFWVNMYNAYIQVILTSHPEKYNDRGAFFKAKSCPPVAIYDTDRIEEQLEVSTKNYLQKFSTYHHSDKIAYVTSLFSWFRGDFGGLEGIKNILIKQNIIPDRNVRLKTAEYDWTLDLDNFVDL